MKKSSLSSLSLWQKIISSIIIFSLVGGLFFLFEKYPPNLMNSATSVAYQTSLRIFQSAPNKNGKTNASFTQSTLVKEKWWRTFFTMPNAPIVEEQFQVAQGFIDLINAAQQQIHIAAFEADYLPIATALVKAHQRGVEVIWITDDEYGLEADLLDENYFFKTLQDAGILVLDDQRSALMHNKFAIFDHRIVWTGSTNLTQNGFNRNNNNAIWINDLTVAEIYENEFDEMRTGNFGPSSPSYQYKQLTKVQDSRIIMLFGSEDSTIAEINYYLSQAKQNIVVMAFSFTHDDLGNMLVKKMEQGVTVATIFEKRGSLTQYSEMSKLFCAGGHIRQDGNPGTMHHKVIIIDGEIVITGSLNFTQNATKKNDENVLIIYNPEIATSYIQEFERLWYQAIIPPTIECE